MPHMPQNPQHQASSATRRFSLPFRHPLLLAGLFAASTSLALISPHLSTAVHASLEASPKEVLDEAWQIVNREYVDTTFNNVDWQEVRYELLNQEYSSTREAYAALNRALRRLQDPYTRFMTPEQYEVLTSQTSGELSGVGIRLQKEDGSDELMIIEVLPNSPAANSGLEAGDRILSIDGEATEDMSLEEASERIRGDEGSSITLEVQRGAENEFEVVVTRARIELTNVYYSLKQEQGMNVGYIQLTEFSAHAAEQMQAAIQDLSEQGAEGFVLDLRGNPGGLLDASIEIARMWLPTGTIVSTVDRGGESIAIRANDTALTQLPLVVLVDGNSASSSEILTGALRDNERATVVGSQTFGKALVQQVYRLSDGSGLAVTISHYYTPNGTDISQLGITPDVSVDLTAAQQQQLSRNPNTIATSADPQYNRAISVLQTDVALRRITEETSQSSTQSRVPLRGTPRQAP
jgi:carboxyl-terminal processing protease